MNSIIVDVEKGVILLEHELRDALPDLTDVPEPIKHAVAHFGESLGLNVLEMGAPEIAGLVHLLGLGIDALSAGQEAVGHAAAGAPAAPAAGVAEAAPAANAGPDTAVSTEQQPAPAAAESEAAAAPAAAEAPAPAASEGATTADVSHIDDVIAKASADFGGGGGAPAA